MAFAAAGKATLERVIPEFGLKRFPVRKGVDDPGKQLVNSAFTRPFLVVPLELARVDDLTLQDLSALSS